MIFEYYQLPSNLDQYVESIFHFKDFIPEYSIERVVPTGHIFIIFELDNIPRKTFDNDTLEPLKLFSKVWISGIHQNYISISAHQNSEMFVIQFKAMGAYPFLHFPVQEISEKIIAAEEVFGQEILELREKMLQVEISQVKFKLAENWLLKRFNPRKAPPTPFMNFMERLQKDPFCKLNKMMESYPNTHKQLIKQFYKYVGLTPKYYHRILRFNEILKIIQRKEKVSWAEVAYSCDYTDQSHFIKEFYHFSGFRPQEFVKLSFNQEDTNFFPLDKKG